MSAAPDSCSKLTLPARHRVAHTFCISDVASRFAQRDIIETDEFCHRHNSQLVSFKLIFIFEEDWFSFKILSCNEFGIQVSMNQIALYDSEGKLLITRKHENMCDLQARHHLIGAELYRASDVRDGENWKICYELEYQKYPQASISNACDLQIHHDYLKLLDASGNADITFIVKDTPIKAHKLILSTRSKYFERMFDTPLRENESNEIVVPDIEPNVFKAMLEFLYSGLPPRNLADVSLELLTVADKYGMEQLATMSETSVLANLDAKTVVDTLLVAEMLNNEKLMARSKEVFREYRDLVKQSEEDVEKLKTSPNLMIDLLFHFANETK